MSSNEQNKRLRPVGSALAVLAVFCLNLLIPPCAVALAEIGEDHDCPHCPPSHAEQHGAHMAGHEAIGPQSGAAEHSAAAAMPCASAAADCGLPDAVNVDARQFDPAFEDLPFDSPDVAIGGPEYVAFLREPFDGRRYALRSPPPTPSQPLNLLFCVWLD